MYYTELPKEGFEKCIICGKKTKGTAFCKECWKNNDKEELLLILNNYVSNDKSTEETKCIICGEKRLTKFLCKDCLAETIKKADTLNKNQNTKEYRDYYYNLKERISIMNNTEKVIDNCKMLFAIAKTNEQLTTDKSLMQRMLKDIPNLISNIKAKNENRKKELPKEIEEKIKEDDDKKEKLKTSQDGHNFKSEREREIDDILYSAYILHTAEKPIDEITEKRKKCDWFIPICNGKGIYIEYWGMDTKKYLEDRKEKEELYIKYNIPYIGIEKDEPKNDSQTFKSNLLKNIRKLAEEKYGFMPEWKK